MGILSWKLSDEDNANWAKRGSYVGTFIIFLTLGFLMYWGNLTVYTQSYIRDYFGPDPEITAPWVLSLRIVGMGVGLIVAGYIAQIIGGKWTIVLGCALMDSTLFLAVFSLKQSLLCMDLILGLVGGLGGGMVFTLCFRQALSFQPKRQGLVTGFMISGTAIGAAFLNQLITWYINPANLAPDLVDGQYVYFTQTEVLERVPLTFVMLGAISLACHVLGIFLMKLNATEDCRKDGINISDVEDNHDRPTIVENGDTSCRTPLVSEEEKETPLTIDVSPRQMLTTVGFYVLWFDVLCSEYSFILTVNFYKMYGETQISNDQFLSCLATAQLLVSVLMRPAWGAFIDLCGVKCSILTLSSITTLYSNFWYFTPIVSQWLYYVWTVMFSCVCCGFYLIFPVATFRLFGKEHFSINYGIVMSSTVLLNLFAPFVMQALVTRYGWFYLFFSVGCVNAVGLILSVLWLPRA